MKVKQTMSDHAQVCVTWHDAHAEELGWCERDEIDAEPCVVRTLGFLIPDAKPDHVVVAQSLAADGDFYGVFAIPTGMVQSLRIL